MYGFFSVQAMCGLLQCGPTFDPKGLTSGGYLYNWLQTVLNSPKEKVGFLLLLITYWSHQLKVTVYLQGCLASKRCSASSLNCRYLNPYIKIKLIELAIKLYQEF